MKATVAGAPVSFGFFEMTSEGVETVTAHDILADATEAGPARLPLPTLADDGSAIRRAAPGRWQSEDPLDERRWHRLVGNTEHVVRTAEFEPAFHRHAGTFVEFPEEIDRFLPDVDVDLTLDTKHPFVAGGDPLDAVRRWGDRINHPHLKDVDLTELKGALAAGGGMSEVWSSGSFIALGKGDIDLAGVMEAMDDCGSDVCVVLANNPDMLSNPAAVGVICTAIVAPTAAALMSAFFSCFPLGIVQGIQLRNELGLANILLLKPASRTLPIGLTLCQGQDIADRGGQFASLMLMVAPMVILCFIFDRKVAEGMRIWAIK
jgi:hypothetical protein